MLLLLYLTSLLCGKCILFLDMQVSIGNSSRISIRLYYHYLSFSNRMRTLWLTILAKRHLRSSGRGLPPFPSCSPQIRSFPLSSCVMPLTMHLGLFCPSELINYPRPLLMLHALEMQPELTTPLLRCNF